MATIILSELIAKKFDMSQVQFDVASDNFSDALNEIDKLHSKFKDSIMLSDNTISNFVVICKNDKMLSRENINEIKLNKDDEIYIVNMIAGG